jgi:hypothetical protein
MRWLAFLAFALVVHAESSLPGIARAAAEDYANARFDAFAARLRYNRPGDLATARQKSEQLRRDYGEFHSTDEVSCEPARGESKLSFCTVVLRYSRGIVTFQVSMLDDGSVFTCHPEFADRLIFGLATFATLLDWSVLYLLPLCAVPFGVRALNKLPFIWGATMFFGVPTPPDFPASPQGTAILKTYRRWNLAIAILTCILIVAIPRQWDAFRYLALLTQFFGMLAVARLIARRVWPYHRLQHERARTAGLAPSQSLSLRMWCLAAVPVLILAGATAYLAVNWSLIPEGVRSVRRIFGPLLFGWSVLIASYGYTALLFWGSRRDGAVELVRAQPGRTIIALVMISVLQAFTAIAFSGLFGREMGYWMLGLLLVAAPLATVIVLLTVRVLPASVPAPSPVPAGLTLSGRYENPADPAWMVRVGYGFQPNYGHRWVGLLLLLLTMLVIGAAFYTYSGFPV